MPATLPVPLRRQQSEGGCLPVCIQMVLDYWGQHVGRLHDTDFVHGVIPRTRGEIEPLKALMGVRSRVTPHVGGNRYSATLR